MKSKISKEVLEVYQRENPSAISIEDRNYYNKFFSGQKELWQGRLKIPLRTFSNARVCDFGCGTGEVDIFMAANKAYIEGADFNPDSIKRARYLAMRFKVCNRLHFKVADIHEKIFQNNTADFAISLGVLPHVKDPEKVFNNMLKTSKKGGYVIIGFVEEMGIVQRLLHRSIVRAIAGLDEKKIIKIARRAFPDHLRRSVKYGLRTERSVIFDYLVNRHMYGLPLEKVINWFEQKRVSYYSSWPSIEPPFEINPYTSSRLCLTHPLLKEYRSLLRLRWLFTQHEDKHVFDRIGAILGDRMISKYVDRFSGILAKLVQNENKWPERDMRRTQNICGKITRRLDDNSARLLKLFYNDLIGKMDDLEKILKKITELQEKRSEDFQISVNLFKELNGLGTFYLAGINNRG